MDLILEEENNRNELGETDSCFEVYEKQCSRSSSWLHRIVKDEVFSNNF